MKKTLLKILFISLAIAICVGVLISLFGSNGCLKGNNSSSNGGGNKNEVASTFKVYDRDNKEIVSNQTVLLSVGCDHIFTANQDFDVYIVVNTMSSGTDFFYYTNDSDIPTNYSSLTGKDLSPAFTIAHGDKAIKLSLPKDETVEKIVTRVYEYLDHSIKISSFPESIVYSGRAYFCLKFVSKDSGEIKYLNFGVGTTPVTNIEIDKEIVF